MRFYYSCYSSTINVINPSVLPTALNTLMLIIDVIDGNIDTYVMNYNIMILGFLQLRNKFVLNNIIDVFPYP